MKAWINRWIVKLEHYVHRPWYYAALFILVLLDMFTLVVPTDTVLISTVLLRPKAWLRAAHATALGSSTGALILFYAIGYYGDPLVQYLHSLGMSQALWQTTENLMNEHGAWALFLIAFGPLPMHPGIVLASLTHMKLPVFLLSVFGGRLAKYLIFAWLASHAPHYLSKIWGIQSELKDLEKAQKEITPGGIYPDDKSKS